jgi:hypothetical protein
MTPPNEGDRDSVGLAGYLIRRVIPIVSREREKEYAVGVSLPSLLRSLGDFRRLLGIQIALQPPVSISSLQCGSRPVSIGTHAEDGRTLLHRGVR